MSVARHPRPKELEGVPVEEIMKKYVGRFREKKGDWAAFEDAKIEGFKRAQHRFIGAGGSGKHGDPTVIPAGNFTLSIMYVPVGPGQRRAHPRGRGVLLRAAGLSRRVRRGRDRQARHHAARPVGHASACPAGVIHGYQNDGLEPVYMQVMLGRGRPETDGLRRRRTVQAPRRASEGGSEQL